MEWTSLSCDLRCFNPIKLTRCCTGTEGSPVNSYSLQGYCDASQRAYTAVVYLRVQTRDTTFGQFLCAKTRVAPVKQIIIPRLELLSALMIARLISVVQSALKSEIPLSGITCYTDSQVALYWITRRDKEWRQFIQNRVIEIRELVPVASWRHCPGVLNPADVPSRGASAVELWEKLNLWLHGPSEVPTPEGLAAPEEPMAIPRECLTEMKTRGQEGLVVSLVSSTVPAAVLPCENYSDLGKLLRVTSYLLRFVNSLKSHEVPLSSTSSPPECIFMAGDIRLALIYWLKVSQLSMLETRNFQVWSKQFGLVRDSSGLWRCGGRLDNAEAPQETKHPVLQNKQHYIAVLITRVS